MLFCVSGGKKGPGETHRPKRDRLGPRKEKPKGVCWGALKIQPSWVTSQQEKATRAGKHGDFFAGLIVRSYAGCFPSDFRLKRLPQLCGAQFPLHSFVSARKRVRHQRAIERMDTRLGIPCTTKGVGRRISGGLGFIRFFSSEERSLVS